MRPTFVVRWSGGEHRCRSQREAWEIQAWLNGWSQRSRHDWPGRVLLAQGQHPDAEVVAVATEEVSRENAATKAVSNRPGA